jgi:hypothetical protein
LVEETDEDVLVATVSALVGWVRVTTNCIVPSIVTYHQVVSLTADVRSQAGVGKSSLINRIFRTKQAVWGHGQRCVQLSSLLTKIVSAEVGDQGTLESLVV